jgi:hypothetical protein
MLVLAAESPAEELLDVVAQMAGLVVLSGAVAALAAFLYRWYVREAIPRGLSLLVGLSGVAIYLNTSRALGQVIGGNTLPTETHVALFNVTAFAVATGGAVLGRRAGDRFGTDVALTTDPEGVEANVGRLVTSVGRVLAVELPSEIEDAVGYDPVPAGTRGELAEKTFLFPRRLTVEELRERLVSRLKTDYAVGHVDVDLADDGTVEYLALGSPAAGIGPTLPPATNAVAIRADPAFAASAGDLVQVWETDPMERVLTAELRGVAGETVTIAIDAADTPRVDPSEEYRLVTLPVEDRPDREFASLLRAADETVSSVTVEADSPLEGLPVAALAVTVVAVTPESEDPLALPEPAYVLAPGERVFAIARPEELRRLDRAGTALDPSLVRDTTAPAETPTEEATARDDPSADRLPGVTATNGPDEATPGEDTAEADTAVTSTGDGAESGPDDADEDREGSHGTPGAGGQADERSFQQFKEQFESGEADWADGPDGEEGKRRADAGSEGAAGSDDAGDGLADLEGGEGDDEGDVDGLPGGAADETDESETPGVLDGEDPLALDGDDDLIPLDGDDGGDELGSPDGDDEGGDEGDGEDTDSNDGDEGDDGDEEGSGGEKSFAQLKEEFESGEADWEDEVSDSPGGDMRLDE